MARYEVAPTRTNLMKLKDDLAFAKEGYELLEQKREILIVELKRFTARAIEAQKRVDEELAAAYAALREAELASGLSGVTSSARAVNVRADIKLRMRRVMGVSIPAASLDLEDAPPYFGPQGTSVWTDEAIVRFKNALAAVAQLAEARISVIRLAREIHKTMRRVNALEHVFIPDYRETIKYVQDSLEEADRESFFMTKIVRDRLEAGRR